MKNVKRMLCLLLTCCLMLGLLSVGAMAADTAPGLQEEEWQVLLLTNRERLNMGLSPLTTTGFLQEIGDIRSAELIELFSHTRPNGSSCFTALNEVGGPAYRYLGENIAAGYMTPQAVVTGWMNSPGHRANILNSSYRHMGVGYAEGGSYRENWVQFFHTGTSCAYTGMTLDAVPGTVPVGTGIDEMRLTAVLTCRNCGSCCLPVMEEFCTGYDPNKVGKQQATISCLGFSKSFPVTVGFTDVPEDASFADAVYWAVEQGITTGDSDTTFGPGKTCTRAQAMTFLWRTAGKPEPAGTGNAFTDVAPSEYYAKAVQWAVEQGITTGTTDTTFSPNQNCTRAQIVTFLWRAKGEPEPSRPLAFTDVVSGEYYEKAVRWALENGIAQGTSDTTFSPDVDSPRSQIVTYLYLSKEM